MGADSINAFQFEQDFQFAQEVDCAVMVLGPIPRRLLPRCQELSFHGAFGYSPLNAVCPNLQDSAWETPFLEAEVERAFRCLKGIDLLVRPIRHRSEERVPAHIFLCLLAYYVEWHLRRAWAPLLFEDEERREERKRRDPVLPAKPTPSAQAKKQSHETREGLPVHSLATLLAEMASRARVTYAFKSGELKLTCKQVPEPTPLQARAYELIRTFPVTGN